MTPQTIPGDAIDTVDLEDVSVGLFIDGRWSPADGGEVFAVINPADGRRMGSAALAGRAEADRALRAADAAFPAWSRTTGDERATVLTKAADETARERARLATVLTREHGKPLADARKEVAAAIDTLRFYAEEGRRISGEISPSRSRTSRSLVVRQPIGPVAAIAPWNYPVSLMAWKLAPALAAGCTVVVKPPSRAPLACTLFGGIVGQAAPPGVANVVTGPSEVVGDELVRSPLSRVIAFTGSSETGRRLMAAAAPELKRLILELGGQTPMVVFNDADLDRAVADGVKRAFRNAGQICNAVNRLYVESGVADEFVERFVGATQQLRLGNGLSDPAVDIGPLIDEAGVTRSQRHVDDAVQKGARLLCGGRRPHRAELGEGSFYEPTVVAGASPEMLVMREESFGPIVGISTFDGLDEAVELANSTPYGLVTYVYTRDLATAMAFSDRVESGTVAVNTVSPDSLYAPYPAWKQSGFGLELSHFGLEEYLQVKHILLESG